MSSKINLQTCEYARKSSIFQDNQLIFSKLITNYNALGTATFIVAYVNSANFEAFWERYSEHILHYDFPLQIKENFSPLVHPNAATRIASMILTRDGFDFPVYFIALKIS